MNYYNFIFFFTLSIINAQVFQFVKFNSDDVQIVNERDQIIVTLNFEILDGYHIQLEKVEDDNLLATKIDFEIEEGLEILNSEFADQHYYTVILDKKTTQVLSKSFNVNVHLKKLKNSNPKALKGKLFYQTCDDFKCYFPRELLFTVQL